MSSLFRRFVRQTLATRTQSPARLQVESLEAREVPAVDLMSIADSDFPTNKPLFVPITVNTSDGVPTYSVTSNNANVSAEVVSGGRSVQFTVRGVDANNQAFTGDITIRLFENIAPLATGNIITLVRNGYYDSKLFHRIVNDFVIQGGSPNGDGVGGSSTITDVRDEYNPQYTFASRGIVAMANAGDDNNNAQFFITDPFILQGGVEVNAPVDRRSQFLNFNHTIVGIMTGGFDLYQKIMNVPRKAGNGNDGAPSSPLNNVAITKAVVLDNNVDGLVKITAASGFLGTAEITVTGLQGTEQSKSFTVTSVADTINERPFLGSISNLTTTPTVAKTFTLPFTELDTTDAVTFTAGTIVNTGNGPTFTTLDPSKATIAVTQDGQVTITPAVGFTGVLDFVVGVRDQQDRQGSSLGLNDARNFDTEKLTLTVGTVASNVAPSISDITNKASLPGTAVGPFEFTISDPETPGDELTVTATSSNTALIPDANLVFGGSTGTRTLTLTPLEGQSGVSTVTVTVTDSGGRFTSDTFTYTVAAEDNTAPTISDIANQIAATSKFGPLSFTVGDTQTAAANLTVTAKSSNASLFPEANLVFAGSGASRTLTATAATGQTGTATVTVTVADGEGATSVDTFTLTVTPASTVTLTSSKTATSTGRPVLFTAAVTNGTGGSVQFRDGDTVLGTVKVVEGKALFTATFNDAISHTVTARFVPASGSPVDSTPFTVSNGSSAAPILITATGSAAGTRNTVTIFNSDDTVRHTLNPYGSYSGVVRVKVGDVTGDGQLDVVAVPGFGGGPHIVVYDGNTGKLVYQNMIYGDNFRGGLSLDVGDAKGLGYSQILVGAGLSGGPRVTLLDVTRDVVLLNYFAYETGNRGGVSVAIGDLRGGNVQNIITGAGQGLGPTIKVYNPFTGTNVQDPTVFGTFLAGSKTDTVGVRVGVGPLIANNRRDILVGDLDTTDKTSLNETFDPQTLGVFVGTSQSETA